MFDLHTYGSLESTNLLVRGRIEAGDAEGFVALAFEQTAGYGRLGRTWASPAGGLYMSVLLRPNVCSHVLPTISFVVALSVRRALAHVLTASQLECVQLKWPNDIVLVGGGTDGEDAGCEGGAAGGGGDIECDADCGVSRGESDSCETKRDDDDSDDIDDSDVRRDESSRLRFNKLVGISQELHHGALCIGVGANVFRPAISQNVAGKNTPVYIAEWSGGVTIDADQQQFIVRLANLILQELESVYNVWQERGFEPFLEEYKQNMCLRGQHIQMRNQLDEQMFEGTVTGINSAGQLLLADSAGRTQVVSSGEVTLV